MDTDLRSSRSSKKPKKRAVCYAQVDIGSLNMRPGFAFKSFFFCVDVSVFWFIFRVCIHVRFAT